MLTAASELTPGVSTLQETDGFRAALKPFDSSCSLRVLSESDKDRPRKSAFAGHGVLWRRRAMEGRHLWRTCRRPGWGGRICPVSAARHLPPAPGARGPASEAKPEKESQDPRVRTGQIWRPSERGSCSGQEVRIHNRAGEVK